MTRSATHTAAALGAADWLGLAAAPSFAIVALLTGVLGGGPPAELCSAAPGASPLGGMAPMYALMSAFHAAPWLKLISVRRGKHVIRQELVTKHHDVSPDHRPKACQSAL